MLFKKTIQAGEKNGVQFVEGVVQFQAVRLNVYCFVVDGVLIDTSAKRLLQQMKGFFDAADFDQVVITHDHEDHTGGAAYIAQRKGVPIYINGDSVDRVASRADYPFYRKVFWGTRKSFQAMPLGEQFESRTATWDVIATPGHAADHKSFYNQQTGQLFSGDLYVAPKTKLVLRSESIPTILDSIERVLTYDFEEVVCCHAGIVQNGRAAILEKQAYLMGLVDNVLTLSKQGMTEKEIHKKLFPKVYPITRFSSGEWDSYHMITSILARYEVKL